MARTAQTSYALRLLRSHGLGAPQIYDVTRGPEPLSLLNSLTHPLHGQVLQIVKNACLQSKLNKVQRAGFLPPNFQNLNKIVDAADVQLFRSIISNEENEHITSKSPDAKTLLWENFYFH